MNKGSILVTVLALASLAFSQAPANLTGLEVNGQTNLASKLSWSPVAGATYNVYSQKHDVPCPAVPNINYEVIATNLSTTTYTDIPLNPNLGPFCYYVTSVVGGVESGPSNVAHVFLGDHWYWYVNYRQPGGDTGCSSNPIVAMPNGLMLTITETTNGVPTPVPVTKADNNTFVGTYRFQPARSTYTAQLTFPDGFVINYKGPIFLNDVPNTADMGTYWRTNLIYGTDAWCSYEILSNFEPASNN